MYQSHDMVGGETKWKEQVAPVERRKRKKRGRRVQDQSGREVAGRRETRHETATERSSPSQSIRMGLTGAPLLVLTRVSSYWYEDHERDAEGEREREEKRKRDRISRRSPCFVRARPRRGEGGGRHGKCQCHRYLLSSWRFPT